MNESAAKVPCQVGLTPRQIRELTSFAKGRGISFAEGVRRALDDWLDARDAAVLLPQQRELTSRGVGRS